MYSKQCKAEKRLCLNIEPITKEFQTSIVLENNGDFAHAINSNPAAREGVIKSKPLMDAVVKVFCAHSAPNFSLPWQRVRQYSSTSSGFIISGRKVKVKKSGSDVKYLATVLAIGNECDIAMLTVEDDEFWEGVSPIEFGPLPALHDAVSVVGYPIGGDTISVTSGVVSRIEIFPYVQGSTDLLGLQIDAAINSGNSGGPAFSNKGKCDVENMGYVIPTAVVMHFIEDYERKEEYTCFPSLGFEWQIMENPDLRMAMGMSSHQKGVRSTRIEPISHFHILKPSDVILSFDGVDITNDGTVLFTHGERIAFSYLVSQKYAGENVIVKVLQNIKTPSYYIVAGFVFTVVSLPFLQSEKNIESNVLMKLYDKYLNGMAQSRDEQIVVISQMIYANWQICVGACADINIGYEGIASTQVLGFNGNPVRNLKSLMVENCDGAFLKFELDYQKIVVLQSKTAKAATQDILSTYSIPSAMSADLKA
ncbi:hypothetical protein MKW94_027239 [Papaver nudicaule]|uniref:Protease Do-like PDZ domain-containing protein n=1 Tax=Papaver nudicaule TaxID=74823 RepID=A0AA41RR60_PAPNU|nr:hypothetical protein [Papaver nudicaule]